MTAIEITIGCLELHAVTGPDYGRIYDHELVFAVQRIARDQLFRLRVRLNQEEEIEVIPRNIGRRVLIKVQRRNDVHDTQPFHAIEVIECDPPS